jgi:hypothetical protein
MKNAKKTLIVLALMQVHSLLFATQSSAEARVGQYFQYVKDSAENSYWSKFPIPRVSANFTSEQRQLLWDAVMKIQVRMQSKAVLECVSKTSTYGYYQDETPMQAAQRFVVGVKSKLVVDESTARKRRQRLFINTGVIDSDSTDAYVRAGTTRNVREDMTMYIVQDKMGRKNSDYWAGVIVHEILHVYTYEHPAYDPNKDYFDQFTGNMMFETEWCVSGRRKKNSQGVWYIDRTFKSSY